MACVKDIILTLVALINTFSPSNHTSANTDVTMNYPEQPERRMNRKIRNAGARIAKHTSRGM